jgi:hypothetical protein
MDFRRAHRLTGRYLDALSREIDRSRGAEAQKALEKAREVIAQTDPEPSTAEATVQLDNVLAYAHRALDALLRQYRMPIHDPGAFGSFYDVTEVPFRDAM